jgi:hypothetical protein
VLINLNGNVASYSSISNLLDVDIETAPSESILRVARLWFTYTRYLRSFISSLKTSKSNLYPKSLTLPISTCHLATQVPSQIIDLRSRRPSVVLAVRKVSCQWRALLGKALLLVEPLWLNLNQRWHRQGEVDCSAIFSSPLEVDWTIKEADVPHCGQISQIVVRLP